MSMSARVAGTRKADFIEEPQFVPIGQSQFGRSAKRPRIRTQETENISAA